MGLTDSKSSLPGVCPAAYVAADKFLNYEHMSLWA